MKKVIKVAILCVIGTQNLFGQLGVNTANPDPSSAIDIQSPTPSSQRGVLMPRMTKAQRLAIASPALSLMVFDTTDNLFYYYDGTTWVALVPKQSSQYAGDPIVKGVIALDSGSVITPNLNAQTIVGTTATVTTTNTVNLNVPGFSTNALVPTGAILMWSGLPTAIPSGWALCNGLAGTPDLSGRFIVGYSNISSSTPAVAPADGITENYRGIGNTGGETGHQLTANELAQHNHVFSATTSTTGAHQHSFDISDGGGSGSGSRIKSGDANTDQSGGRGSVEGDHAHTLSGTTNNNSSSQSVHENRPPYYVLASIIKLP